MDAFNLPTIMVSIKFNFDDFAKNPSAALCYILSHCGVQVSTPHSFVFARFASEAFYFVVLFYLSNDTVL